MLQPLIGIVEVAGKAFTVSEMKFGSEYRLGLLLRQMYERQQGSPYKRLLPMLDEMTPADRATAVDAAARAKIASELPGGDAREMARQTPEGVALELWMRARKHHKGLTQKEVEAVVTEANCQDVLDDIIDVLTPKQGSDDSKS